MEDWTGFLAFQVIYAEEKKRARRGDEGRPRSQAPARDHRLRRALATGLVRLAGALVALAMRLAPSLRGAATIDRPVTDPART